jgi:hypothetical protein
MPETSEKLRLRFYRVRGSQQIERVAYDPASHTLFVKFVGSSLYLYRGVPAESVAGFLFADSVGATFNELIKKGGYEYEKLAQDHEAWQILVAAEAGA